MHMYFLLVLEALMGNKYLTAANYKDEIGRIRKVCVSIVLVVYVCKYTMPHQIGHFNSAYKYKCILKMKI